MITERIEKIILKDFLIFVIDLTELEEDEIIFLFKESTRLAHETGEVYGTIYNTKFGVPTPQIRQLGKKLTIESEKTGRYIGSTIYGVNAFIKMVAKLSNDKVLFGDNKDECIQLIQEMYEGKRPNYLPLK